ncbi:MAG: hypothetical protein R2726_07550 [Acidimicrobiales bacterium]
MRRGLVVLAVMVALSGCGKAEEVARRDEPATTATTAARATGTTSANPEKKTRIDHPGTTVRRSATPVDLWEAPALADLQGPAFDDDLVEVTDETGRLRLRAPAAWTTDGAVRTVEGSDVPAVYVTEDQQAYSEGFDVAGIGVNLYPPTLVAEGDDWALDRLDARDGIGEACDGATTSVTYEGDRLSGRGDVTSGCRTADSAGARPAVVVHLVASTTDDEDVRLVVQAQLLTRADLDALEAALDSLVVGRPVTSTSTTTTTPAPVMTPVPGGGGDDAIALVTARVRACGFDASDARASRGWVTETGIEDDPGKWSVTVRLSKVGEDYGTTEYVVNVEQGVVYSEGAIAKEYCP